MKSNRPENNNKDARSVKLFPIEESVKEVVERHGVGRVVAGVSGGADSVALLCALQRSGIETVAVHCNFHLRGEESERDRQFVESLCLRLGIPFQVMDIDVEDYRREHGGSVEMACRELRYRRFREIKEERSADRIAVAHNSDDNAETLLLNLFRGAGVAGLAAMKVDTGEVIRPLLSKSRKEIEGYLAEIGEEYVTDSTNLESDYRRNFIRNRILPMIEEEWPGAKESINRTARIMREEDEAMVALSKELRDSSELRYEEITAPGSGIWRLRRFVTGKGGGHHIADEILRSVGEREPDKIRRGARWNVPGGWLVLGRDGVEWLEKELITPETDIKDKFEIREHSNSPELMKLIRNSRDNRVLWIPVGPEGFQIRTRHEGDRIRPLGMTGSRLVSDIISDAKLTAAEKATTAVLEEIGTGELIWVEGLKRSRKLLVKPEDELVWEVSRRKNSKKEENRGKNMDMIENKE